MTDLPTEMVARCGVFHAFGYCNWRFSADAGGWDYWAIQYEYLCKRYSIWSADLSKAKSNNKPDWRRACATYRASDRRRLHIIDRCANKRDFGHFSRIWNLRRRMAHHIYLGRHKWQQSNVYPFEMFLLSRRIRQQSDFHRRVKGSSWSPSIAAISTHSLRMQLMPSKRKIEMDLLVRIWKHIKVLINAWRQ